MKPIVYGPADIDRFWEHVAVDSGCWLWRGSVQTGGYGVFGVGGTQVLAHRFAWTVTYGAIPETLPATGAAYDWAFVLHRCDVRRCVRPEHLFLGTQRDNLDDAANKRRARLAAAREDLTLTEWARRVLARALDADGSPEPRP